MERLAMDKHSSLLRQCKKASVRMKCCEYDTGSLFMSVCKGVAYQSAILYNMWQVWKELPWTNTLAYWASV
jgi:hypothetical protein